MKSSNPKNNNPKGHPATLTPYRAKWKSGKTRTIRVPIAIADEVLAAARLIDAGEDTSDNSKAIEILINALKLKVSSGGAIKKEIRKALKLLEDKY